MPVTLYVPHVMDQTPTNAIAVRVEDSYMHQAVKQAVQMEDGLTLQTIDVILATKHVKHVLMALKIPVKLATQKDI